MRTSFLFCFTIVCFGGFVCFVLLFAALFFPALCYFGFWFLIVVFIVFVILLLVLYIWCLMVCVSCVVCCLISGLFLVRCVLRLIVVWFVVVIGLQLGYFNFLTRLCLVWVVCAYWFGFLAAIIIPVLIWLV